MFREMMKRISSNYHAQHVLKIAVYKLRKASSQFLTEKFEQYKRVYFERSKR